PVEANRNAPFLGERNDLPDQLVSLHGDYADIFVRVSTDPPFQCRGTGRDGGRCGSPRAIGRKTDGAARLAVLFRTGRMGTRREVAIRSDWNGMASAAEALVAGAQAYRSSRLPSGPVGPSIL